MSRRLGCQPSRSMIASIMTREHLNPSELPNWSETFSQVVVMRTAATRTIYVSVRSQWMRAKISSNPVI